MSSKMQFQVFFGDYNILYGPNGVDLPAFKCTCRAIDKPLEMSFNSICKWLQRGFRVDPLTHVTLLQSKCMGLLWTTLIMSKNDCSTH